MFNHQKRAQLLAVANKFVVVAFGLLIAILVTRKLSSYQQGVYFVFQSMIAFSALAELGVGYSMTQLTGIAVGTARISQEADLERVGARYLKFAIRWFSVAGFVVCLVIGPVGHFWLADTRANTANKMAEYFLPWYILVISNGILIFSNGVLAFFEGYGDNLRVYFARLISNLISHVSIVFSIQFEFEAKSVVVGACVNALVMVLMIYYQFGRRLTMLFKLGRNLELGVEWKNNIRRFQTNISVSWLFGVLSNHAAVPLVYRFAGPIEAGKLGLSLQMCSVLNGISICWILANSSRLARYFGQGNTRDRKKLFLSDFAISIVIIIFLVISMVVCLNFVLANHWFDAERIVKLNIVYILLLPIAIVAHINNSMAVFIRSSGVEPLTKCSIISSLTTIVMLLLLIPKYGSTGAIISIAFVSLVVSFPWIYLFYKEDINRSESSGLIY